MTSGLFFLVLSVSSFYWNNLETFQNRWPRSNIAVTGAVDGDGAGAVAQIGSTHYVAHCLDTIPPQCKKHLCISAQAAVH